MRARITLVTLGVDDLDRAVGFYRDGLGWRTQGIVGSEFEYGAVAFFDLQDGLRLALWPRNSIARDSGMASGAANATELTLGHNVASRAEVDRVMARAQAAGARIPQPAHETFWGGYAGYFQDPDGHLWEVAWNPEWVADAAATATLEDRGQPLGDRPETSNTPSTSADEREIRALVARWIEASRAGDVETVLDLMADDAVFLRPGAPPMDKQGFAAAAQAQSGADAPVFDGRSEICELRILGDWAYLWTRLTVTVTFPDDRPAMTRAGHTLSILRKENGRWRLARDANLLAPVGPPGSQPS